MTVRKNWWSRLLIQGASWAQNPPATSFFSNSFEGVIVYSDGDGKDKRVEELEVFKLSHSLVLNVYKLTENFPPEERFGLIQQMRRSAYSIPMNLIEGSNRLSTKEYRRFVGIAKGSAGEISYQVMLAKDLGYVPEEVYSELKNKYEIVIKMLSNLAKSLAKKDQ
jgi:four helix bundle protein